MRAALLALALLALVAVGGCGGDDETETVTRTVTAPTSTRDFTPPPETTPTTTEEPPATTEEPPATTDEPPSTSGPSQEDAQGAARTAANDYTGSQYGISGSPDDWEAVCTGEGDVFSCAVTFNGGQCNGRLTLRGPELTPRDERIGCGE